MFVTFDEDVEVDVDLLGVPDVELIEETTFITGRGTCASAPVSGVTVNDFLMLDLPNLVVRSRSTFDGYRVVLLMKGGRS
jgi:hypothetical protein